MNAIYYLLEANLYLAAFYLLYILLLRSQTHYQLNRVYLLVTSSLAFVIPVLQLGFLKADSGVSVTIGNLDADATMVVIAPAAQQAHHFTLIECALMLYAMISLAMFISLMVKIFKLIRLSRQGETRQIGGHEVIVIPAENAAFSFFNYLFINKQFAASAAVLNHEQVHIRQKHSWDIVYLELLKVANWFNPVVYLLQKSLKEVHEFIADEQAVQHEADPADYAGFLISNAYGVPQTVLTNSFFNKNLLKRRIIMLYQKKSGNWARLTYLLALPLAGGLLCVSTLAFTSKTYGWVDVAPRTTAETIKPESSALDDIKRGFKDGFDAAIPDLPAQPVIATTNSRATFPGGVEAFIDYLHKHFDHSVIKTSGPKDAIAIEMTVAADGTLTNIKVTPVPKTQFSDANVNEVLRVLKSSPKWVPAVKNGVQVSSHGDAILFRLVPRNQTPVVHFTPPAPAAFQPNGTSQSKNAIFNAVEQQPQFPGGEAAFSKFLATNIHYPAKARANKIQGRAIVQFVVEPTGELSSVMVRHEPGYGTGAEAARVIKLSPKWIPGMQNGKKVRVQYTVPVNFTLDNTVTSAMQPGNQPPAAIQQPVHQTTSQTPINKNTVYNAVEKQPEFPGGEAAFSKFLATNIHYPAKARENNAQGRAYIQFVVEPTGALSSVKIIREPGYGTGDEAARVIKLSPKWIPGMQNGKKVRVQYTVPVNFSLDKAKVGMVPLNQPAWWLTGTSRPQAQHIGC